MIRVLELSDNVAAAFCGLLLAETGCEVIKVEPPSGDPVRALGDGYESEFLDRRKLSVQVDWSDAAHRARFLDLVRHADAVVETFGAVALEARGVPVAALREANPDLLIASITPFGAEGPQSEWIASELVAEATSGILPATGWVGEPPQKLPGYPAHYIAGLNAAIALLCGVLGVRRGTTGGAQFDISVQESLGPHWARHISRYVYGGRQTTRRYRDAPGPQGFPDTARTRDGWIYLLALRAEWEHFALFLGLENFVTGEWADPAARLRRWEEMRPVFERLLLSRTRYEWFAGAAAEGFTFAPVDSPEDLLHSPQLAARETLESFTSTSGRPMLVPRIPFRAPVAPVAPNRVPVPGEHTRDILDHPQISRAGQAVS